MKSWKLLAVLSVLIMVDFVSPVGARAGALEDALDNPVQIDGITPLVFSSSSSTAYVPWTAETATWYPGGSNTIAAQSGPIGNSMYSSITTTVFGPASVSFYQKVSSQLTYDTLTFSLNGLIKSTISGTVNWQQKIFTLPTGTHTLVWKYAKNATINGGSDAAWIDKVIVSPNTALKVTSPNGKENFTAGSTVNITWNAPAAAEKYSLSYSTNNGASWIPITSGLTSPNFSNITYSWTVPTPNGNMSTCKVKVVAYNAANAVVGTDMSDLPFTITVLKVTSPNGGESFSPTANPATINFVVTGLTNSTASATLSYSLTGGVSWVTIGKIAGGIAPGPYSYPFWNVPASTALKTACRVKVVITSGTGAVLASDTSNANFTIQPVFMLSGTVTANGKALSGVTMTLGGAEAGTTTTDSLGKYSFTKLLPGSYTVTVAKPGYVFNPSARVVAITTANISTASFAATASSGPTYTISGTVSGATVTSVTMTLSGTLGGSVLTDVNGNYSFTNLPQGNYSVTPGKTGYTLDPLSRGVTLSIADATGIDFTASTGSGATYSISGKATLNGVALSGVLISVTGDASAEGITDAVGNYLIKGLKSGNYTITPRKFGCAFSPTTRTIASANIANLNFIAKAAHEALVTLSSAITGTIPSGTLVEGYEVTVLLPSGVTVKSTTDPPLTDSGVVTFSAATEGAMIDAVYTAATSTTPGQVTIILVKTDGLSTGVFCTVSCDISAGSNPRTSDFIQPIYSVSGYDTVTNSTVDLSNQLTITGTISVN